MNSTDYEALADKLNTMSDAENLYASQVYLLDDAVSALRAAAKLADQLHDCRIAFMDLKMPLSEEDRLAICNTYINAINLLAR